MASKDRIIEVEKHISDLGIRCDESEIAKLANELDELGKGHRGCISIGGSSVKDWLRLRVRRTEKVEPKSSDTEHVTCLFHFWPWDEEMYGPQPRVEGKRERRPSRSPTTKMQDAKPIDRVAKRVAKKPRERGVK